MLTYAGRLQLIASVHSALHVYWASIFIIPKTVINDIDKIQKDFLWGQTDIKKGKAMVVWKQLCYPKDQGGLGLKDLGLWNEALMSKHLWNIASNKESLWILSLREKIRNHIVKLIGDGWSTFMWHDTWWGSKPLSYHVSTDIIKKIGMDEDMKVADMIVGSTWKWPSRWQNEIPLLTDIPVPRLIPNKLGDKGIFSVNMVWNDTRETKEKVPWCDVVWFSYCVHRHAFILWLAIQGRLSTQDRMHKWYPRMVATCPLCSNCPDPHTHLFFECQFSKQIWGMIKDMAQNRNISYVWKDIIDQFSKMPCKRSIGSIVRRLCLAASVYFIWNERHRRLFANEKVNDMLVVWVSLGIGGWIINDWVRGVIEMVGSHGYRVMPSLDANHAIL
ncbi:RNA-directed DNA polymerase, eukaryota, reverse transcriptase zinc-binding domain protein [Tanacetum coccineum]